MLPYIAEFLGTMILIILGDGVVANVNLNKSGMKVRRNGSDHHCLGSCGYAAGMYIRSCIRSIL